MPIAQSETAFGSHGLRESTNGSLRIEVETQRSQRTTKESQRHSYWLIAKTREWSRQLVQREPGSILRTFVRPSWFFVHFVFQRNS